MTEVIPGLPAHPPAPGSVTVAVGAFDGVHLGHRRLVSRLAAEARRLRARPVALTLEPHPRCVLDPSGCPPQLTALEERLELLRDAGADEVYVVRFDLELSRWGAERFLLALGSLGPLAGLVAGPGFALGHRREGTAPVLRRLAALHSFSFKEVPPALLGGRPVSSSRIRSCLADGKVGGAARMLGRPYGLEGVVVRGKGRGRALGYPTANLDVAAARCVPAPGIYAGRVEVGGSWLPAAASVGTNPTFGPGAALSVEAHILDFDADLYGQRLRLEFVRRLRAERRFPTPDDLVRQIGLDVERTRRVLA